MTVRECDICGKIMRMAAPHYKITLDARLYTESKDICVDCFNRIKDEIRQAKDSQMERGE